MGFYYNTSLRYYVRVWVLPLLLPFAFFYFFRDESINDSIESSVFIFIVYKFIVMVNEPYFLSKTTDIVSETNTLFDTSKHFLYMNRTFFGLYNLLHDLKAEIKVNDFQKYLSKAQTLNVIA